MPILQRIKTFFWWFRVVLTFGDVTETSFSASTDDTETEFRKVENEEVSVKFVQYDGRISSVQLLVAIISLGLSFSLWRILSTMDPVGTANMLMLIVYMLIGLAILVYFNQCRARILMTEEEMAMRMHARNSTSKGSDLLLVGITVFYFLGCILDVFHIISSTCNGTLLECQLGRYTLSNGIHIAYHVVRIVFLGTQTLFCIAFNRSKLSMKCSTLCGLTCLAAINICLWFDTLTTRIVRIIHHETNPANIWQACFLNESDMSVEAEQCLAKNTTMHRLVDRYVSPLLLPFTFQVVLLLIGCFTRITYHFAKTSDFRKILDYGTQSEDRTEDYELSESSRVSEFQESSTTDDSTPLLRSVSGIQMVGSQAWFLFIFIANVLLMALTVLVRIYTVSSAFVIYTFSYYIGMLLAILLAYHVSGDFKFLMNVPFSAIDYVLVLTSFGQITLNFMSLLAHATLSKNVFVTIQRLVKIVETYCQASFVLYAARIEPRKGDYSFKSVVFRHTILLLAVCNSTLWILTMGYGLNLSGDPHSRGELVSYREETKCYGAVAWTIVYGSLAPLQIMYRFMCCLWFTRTFLRLRRFMPSNLQ